MSGWLQVIVIVSINSQLLSSVMLTEWSPTGKFVAVAVVWPPALTLHKYS